MMLFPSAHGWWNHSLIATWLLKNASSTRLSRARRIVENAFGILAHRWRCSLTTMQQDYEIVKIIVSACLCLHNLRYPGLQNYDADREENDHNITPGSWKDAAVLQDMIHVQGSNQATRDANGHSVWNATTGTLCWIFINILPLIICTVLISLYEAYLTLCEIV